MNKSSDVGHAVRDARTRLGWTQGEVADRADVTRYWVTNLELGKGNPTLSSLLAVLQAVGLTLSVSFEHDGGDEPSARELAPPVDLESVLSRTRRT